MIDNTMQLQVIPTNFSVEGYAKDWGHWQIVREIISNAIDEVDSNFRVYKAGEDLIIEDGGQGIDVISLIMGESHKQDSNKAIGQFGEGLKLAMLVLTREGKLCEIFSRKLYVRNASSELKGIKILQFEYSESEVELYDGTRIIIHDWNDETFVDKFLMVNDVEICHKNPKGEILLKNELYNKGVFIKDLSDNEFGYNLNIGQINRDRNVIDDWTLQHSIGEIWSQCDNIDGWKMFFDAVKEGKKERDINCSMRFDDDAKEAMKMGFEQSFGKNTVLKTNEEISYEARHRKANVIEKSLFCNSLLSEIETFVKTDMDYVIEKKGIKFLNVPLSQLTEIQKKNFSICKRLAKQFNFNPKNIIICNMLNEAYGESDGIVIRIHVEALNSTTEMLSTFIHELTHHKWGTSDNTDAHVRGCCNIGAMIFMMENHIKDVTVIRI